MKMLFIRDVVGKSGRRALRRFLPELQDETEADLTVVNAENAAGGFGVTAGVLEEAAEAYRQCLALREAEHDRWHAASARNNAWPSTCPQAPTRGPPC